LLPSVEDSIAARIGDGALAAGIARLGGHLIDAERVVQTVAIFAGLVIPSVAASRPAATDVHRGATALIAARESAHADLVAITGFGVRFYDAATGTPQNEAVVIRAPNQVTVAVGLS